MPKSPQEEGDKDRFSMRVGVEAVSRLKGMNRQVDAGAIPDDQFYHLENSRIVGAPGGGVRPRFGQLRSSSVDDGDVVGLFDASDIGAPTEVGGIGAAFECSDAGPGEPVAQRLYGSGSSIALGSSLAMYDPVNGTRFAGDLNMRQILRDPNAPRVLFVAPPALVGGMSTIEALGANSNRYDRVLSMDYPVTADVLYSGGVTCWTMTVLGGQYFFGRQMFGHLISDPSAGGDLGRSDVAVWDGVSPTITEPLELVQYNGAGSGGLGGPIHGAGAFPVVFTYLGEVWAGISGGSPAYVEPTTTALYRRTGVGTWVPVTIPVTGFALQQAITYPGDGFLYLVGTGTQTGPPPTAGSGPLFILKWNGTTVTVAKGFTYRYIPGPPLEPDLIRSPLYYNPLDGYLYYFWVVASDPIGDTHVPGAGDAWLGRYDGATWDDYYRNFTALGYVDPGFLGSFLGEIHLASQVTTPFGMIKLLRTTGNNLGGSFTPLSNCFSVPRQPGAVL